MKEFIQLSTASIPKSMHTVLHATIFGVFEKRVVGLAFSGFPSWSVYRPPRLSLRGEGGTNRAPSCATTTVPLFPPQTGNLHLVTQCRPALSDHGTSSVHVHYTSRAGPRRAVHKLTGLAGQGQAREQPFLIHLYDSHWAYTAFAPIPLRMRTKFRTHSDKLYLTLAGFRCIRKLHSE